MDKNIKKSIRKTLRSYDTKKEPYRFHLMTFQNQSFSLITAFAICYNLLNIVKVLLKKTALVL